MWFKNILRRSPAPAAARSTGSVKTAEPPLFDEAFLRRLERLSLQAQRTLRGNPASGQHPSRRRLPTSIFSEHRPYSSGDDLRYVDWNAYARQDHILLKLGEAEQDINVFLMIDASRSMTWGQPAKLRAAQRLAGALGYLALAHSDRLHVIPFGKTAQRPFGPAQGKARMLEMMRFIEGIAPQTQTDLRGVLQQHARRYPQGGLLVLCSDLLSADGLEEGLQLLTPPRWQVLVAHLLDPRELRPDLQGPLELEDSESGQRIQLTLDAETLAAYRRNLTRWQEFIAASCARCGATYTQLLSNWPLERKVMPYLRARRLLN
jgi:uncharacterized protein (DUF58 family)